MKKINLEQIEACIIEHKKTLAKIEENQKNTDKRLEESIKIINQIHNLAKSVETLAYQVKDQGDRLKEMLDNQKDQDNRIDTLEKKPGTKWESLVSQLTGLIIAAVFGGIIAKLAGG